MTFSRTTGENAVLALGFRGFHRESQDEPTYKGKVLFAGSLPLKFPNYMKRKCFWQLSTGWLVLRPKNLIPKDEYKEYAVTNFVSTLREFITWPTLKNGSLYAKKVRAAIHAQKEELSRDLVTPKYSPLHCVWVFHGDVYQGKYKVVNVEKTGVWIERL